MKLSWKDIVTTLLATTGAAVVYAKYYNFSWAVVGSWRGAVAVVALIGLVMFVFSSFDFSNHSYLNDSEKVLGVIAIGLAAVGMIVSSQPVFYVLAATLGLLWLVDTARHIRHSIINEDITSYHHHAPVH